MMIFPKEFCPFAQFQFLTCLTFLILFEFPHYLEITEQPSVNNVLTSPTHSTAYKPSVKINNQGYIKYSKYVLNIGTSLDYKD